MARVDPNAQKKKPNLQDLESLAQSIQKQKYTKAVKKIRSLELDEKVVEDNHFPEGSDINLLQYAAFCSLSDEPIWEIAQKWPRLLTAKRRGHYKGQMVLHTLVSMKEREKLVDKILFHRSTDKEMKEKLLSDTVYTNQYPANLTVMMGGLPLSIAALTFNRNMVDILLRHTAKLEGQNDRKETVFHSLIRFSNLYPDKETDAEGMMKHLHSHLKMSQPDWRSVWLLENQDGLTALQLAAKLTQPLLFHFILTLDGVYCDMNDNDGLLDSLEYDITEIDPDAARLSQKEEKLPALPPAEMMPKKRKSARPAPKLVTSVLDLLCQTDRNDSDNAFKILDNFVVQRVVKKKWDKNKVLFIFWSIIHISLLIFLAIAAVFKARLVCYKLQLERNATNRQTAATNGETSGFSNSFTAFMIFTTMFELFVAMITFILLVVVLRHRREKWSFFEYYRLQLVLFALSLLLDSIFTLAHTETSTVSVAFNTTLLFFAILTLVLGCWFTTFFLRPFKRWSFFTVMLTEVLMGDMVRFLCVFVPVLIAFSLAMHIIFLSSPDPIPEDFEDIPKTLMTMFKLMLGLTEVEKLYDGPQDLTWLAVLLFIIFVILTYALMLNALIALMSNTCSVVSQNRDSQWKMEKLKVVQFLNDIDTLCKERILRSKNVQQSLDSGGHVTFRDIQVENQQTDRKRRYFMTVCAPQRLRGTRLLANAALQQLNSDQGPGDQEPADQDPQFGHFFDILTSRTLRLTMEKKEDTKSLYATFRQKFAQNINNNKTKPATSSSQTEAQASHPCSPDADGSRSPVIVPTPHCPKGLPGRLSPLQNTPPDIFAIPEAADTERGVSSAALDTERGVSSAALDTERGMSSAALDTERGVSSATVDTGEQRGSKKSRIYSIAVK